MSYVRFKPFAPLSLPLSATHMHIATDRRTSPRQSTVSNFAIVQVQHKGKICQVGARLVNISPSGAMLKMWGRPQINKKLRIRLQSPIKTDWIGASIIRVSDSGDVGIAFKHPCNRSLLWAATRHLDIVAHWEPPSCRPAGSHEDSSVRRAFGFARRLMEHAKAIH